MPRRRDAAAGTVVHRTARIGLRLTRAQAQRCFGLLRSAGDVWACVLEINAWRRRRGDAPAAGYQELCRLLAHSGPGTFGQLDSTGARSVLRRYSDAWFAAAARRKKGALEVRFPRRRRALMLIRWYHGTFTLTGRQLRLPTARGTTPLQVRLDRTVPYPPNTIRAVTLLFTDGRLTVDVTAELPIAAYPPGQHPDPERVASIDLGIIHPFAVTTRTLTVGDPRGVLDLPAGRRHNLRLRQWQLGRTLQILHDKAALAGIRVHLVDERGTSSTCPACHQKITKPAGRAMSCRHCQFAGHRDLAAAFTIATRTPGGAPTTCGKPTAGVVTHRRAGQHLPGVATARRDPRRRPPRTATNGSLGRRRPAPPLLVGSRSPTTCERGSTTPPRNR